MLYSVHCTVGHFSKKSTPDMLRYPPNIIAIYVGY